MKFIQWFWDDLNGIKFWPYYWKMNSTIKILLGLKILFRLFIVPLQVLCAHKSVLWYLWYSQPQMFKSTYIFLNRTNLLDATKIDAHKTTNKHFYEHASIFHMLIILETHTTGHLLNCSKSMNKIHWIWFPFNFQNEFNELKNEIKMRQQYNLKQKTKSGENYFICL